VEFIERIQHKNAIALNIEPPFIADAINGNIILNLDFKLHADKI
jgi:hypothetical protein